MIDDQAEGALLTAQLSNGMPDIKYLTFRLYFDFFFQQHILKGCKSNTFRLLKKKACLCNSVFDKI